MLKNLPIIPSQTSKILPILNLIPIIPLFLNFTESVKKCPNAYKTIRKLSC